MTFNQILMLIICCGIVIGAVDYLLKNRFGIGRYFEEAIKLMGDLSITVIGLLLLMPVLGSFIAPFVSPALTAIGIDPSVIATLLAEDVGGYSLAISIAANEQMGLYCGCIVSAMLGAGIIGLPIAQSMIDKEDEPYFMRGLLIGLISVPFGSLVGGFVAGFDSKAVLINTIPVTVFAALLAWGLYKIPNGMVKGCKIFSKILRISAIAGLVIGAVEALMNITILPGMLPFFDGAKIIINIILVVMGAYPLVGLALRLMKKKFTKLGARLGYDAPTFFGLMISSVNIFPTLRMYKDMCPKGKIINAAWMVPMVGAFGDLLAFNAAVAPEMIFPMILAKLVSGIICLLMTRLFISDMKLV